MYPVRFDVKSVEQPIPKEVVETKLEFQEFSDESDEIYDFEKFVPSPRVVEVEESRSKAHAKVESSTASSVLDNLDSITAVEVQQVLDEEMLEEKTKKEPIQGSRTIEPSDTASTIHQPRSIRCGYLLRSSSSDTELSLHQPDPEPERLYFAQRASKLASKRKRMLDDSSSNEDDLTKIVKRELNWYASQLFDILIQRLL
jgi:hypothetical protein